MNDLHKAVFLVVDDFESMRKVTLGQLRVLGATEVLTANNGAEALRVLRSQKVDVVLSDWNMPVMTGLELLRTVRADSKLRALPFIMITAEAARARVAEAIASGVSDLLVKPYNAENLARRIEKAMSGSAPRPPVSDDAAPATKKAVRPPSILVVDDTPDNLRLLSHLFSDEYVVRVANNGERALEMCQSDDTPDLVLLDIMMPGMDGFEVARRMREHPSSETIPIIFVTAMSGDDARLRGLELGAIDFVAKPIDPNVLKPRVRNFMRYVELRKGIQADYDEMLESARLRDDVECLTRHDIKGPLAGVIGLAQTLAADPPREREQLIEQLRLIEETALQALDLINLSSELLKIEKGVFELHAAPVAIDDILQRVADMTRAAFAERSIAIRLNMGDAPPRALGDAMLCYSLFQNLVKNACEAAPAGGEVGISIRSVGDGSPLAIVVSNPGAVPAAIRDSFFDKYVTAGKSGGTGLGTYSARLLTEAQHGTIALAVSDAQDTTEVTVILPRA